MRNNNFRGSLKKPIKNPFSATQLHILLYNTNSSSHTFIKIVTILRINMDFGGNIVRYNNLLDS